MAVQKRKSGEFPMNSADSLERLREEINACYKCGEAFDDIIFAHRVGTVSRSSQDVFMIAERPGQRAAIYPTTTAEEYEALQEGSDYGRFINDLGLSFVRVYFSNIVKCAAEFQRDATAIEANNCRSFLFRQIAIKCPRVLIACGKPTLKGLRGKTFPVGADAGRIIDWTHPRTQQVFKTIISPNPGGTYFKVHKERILEAVRKSLWSLLPRIAPA
jgi:uracil-DNA glycosylase family 4